MPCTEIIEIIYVQICTLYMYLFTSETLNISKGVLFLKIERVEFNPGDVAVLRAVQSDICGAKSAFRRLVSKCHEFM